MIRLRLEFLFVWLMTAVIGGLDYALGFLVGVLVHEGTHGAVARLLGGRGPLLDVQLGAGDAYTAQMHDGVAWVLAAGPFVSALLVLLLVGLPWGPPMFALGVFHWTVYQIFPHPSSDLGVAVRRGLERFGARRIFVTLAVASCALAAAVGAAMWQELGPQSVEPFVPWAAVAVLVALSEWPAVVHGEAWRAWQAGDHGRTLALARGRKGRRWLELRRLGLEAAMQVRDPDAVSQLGEGLSTLEPMMLRATAWMLEQDDARGARWAERLVDVMSAGSRSSEEAAEVVAEYGLYEARRGALESSLGLFEQARRWGFDRVEWLDFRPEVQPLRRHPRWIGAASS